ncbi:enoyl-CoA hydratase/isomerase family protein [Nocardia neocaledoniensis]|uniref:enoyl-CoA hydratase/isomerase family protein n=1 Tax=Nocardia neocaledoniensis TaxID=236511 RepID=UPI002454C453|nr:enoyl-CoA hydratase-related protein [Nocardia neocaledoniensis]
MDEVLTERSGAVLTVTLNRPERLNAFTADTMGALSDACVQASDSAIRAVVLTGKGRGFCAGPDLSAPKLEIEPGSRRLRRFYNPAIVELATLAKPVIAAVNGPAAGAGISLAFAADIRIASDRARFVPGFADMGLAPDTGTSYFLVRLIGYSRALHFLASGEPLIAEQALAMGVVNEVVEHTRLLIRAHELAEQMAGKPGFGVSATKALLWDSARSSLLEQLEAEARTYDVASTNEERLAARAAMVRRLKGN